MHIPPYENRNRPVVGIDDESVPLTYFNILKMVRDESFSSTVPGYETCIVPVHGTVDVTVAGPGFADELFEAVGARASLWEDDPSAVYVPAGATARLVCRSPDAEVFVAGARFDVMYRPFVVRPADIDMVQYGSDD